MTDPIQPPPGYTATPPTKEEWEEYERSQQAQKPWPTERPERWGVGHLCEVQRSPENVYRGICVVDDSDEYATVLVPSEASVWEFPLDQITGYGPRAEVQ